MNRPDRQRRVEPESARETPVLIIGAGPFGLSLGAYLRGNSVPCLLAGEPMSFWRNHMPRGMLLRSGLDWHLDVVGEATLSEFVRQSGLDESSVLPLSRDRYLEYVAWFIRQEALDVSPLRVRQLDIDENGRFVARCEGETVLADAVVVATGFRDYANVPEDLASMLSPGTYGHSCDVVEFERFRGQSIVVVGGRQSAFESAALLAEAGARSVDVVYRHETPSFTASDWSWVEPLMLRLESEPAWYRQLPEAERAELNARFWGEGRHKLEPWLAPRLDRRDVRLWPRDRIAAIERDGERMGVRLASDARLDADFILFATGYKVDLARLPFLVASDLLERIETRNGFPALDTSLQSSVEGLYFTSIAAAQDFGAFFAFTVSARCSAKLIGDALAHKQRDI